MKVTAAEFVKSALLPEDYPKDGRPECAFVGRSNVGKSTLLNILLNRRGLAKTSKRPGKTQTVNFFDVNGRCYFVDLPGYGFAKVARELQEEWGRALTAYLSDREPLRLVVMLLDARHTPTEKDEELLDLLETAEVPTLLVATKADKLKASEKEQSLKTIRRRLGLADDAAIIPFSAITKEGLRDLWRVVDDCLGAS